MGVASKVSAKIIMNETAERFVKLDNKIKALEEN
jgi:hypothetical protein